MAEKDMGSGDDGVSATRLNGCSDPQNSDLQDLLRELDRPLDQTVVDRGLQRLATFVAGQQ